MDNISKKYLIFVFNFGSKIHTFQRILERWDLTEKCILKMRQFFMISDHSAFQMSTKSRNEFLVISVGFFPIFFGLQLYHLAAWYFQLVFHKLKKDKKILFIDFPQFPKVTSCDIAKSFFFACALKSLSSSFLYALLNSDFINLKKGIGVYHVSFLPFLWFALLLMMKSRFWRFLTTILFSLHTSLIIIRESQLDITLF